MKSVSNLFLLSFYIYWSWLQPFPLCRVSRVVTSFCFILILSSSVFMMAFSTPLDEFYREWTILKRWSWKSATRMFQGMKTSRRKTFLPPLGGNFGDLSLTWKFSSFAPLLFWTSLLLAWRMKKKPKKWEKFSWLSSIEKVRTQKSTNAQSNINCKVCEFYRFHRSLGKIC